MPRRRSRPRFRPHSSRSHMERFLQRCCFICMNALNEYPSKRLPCCSQFIHEECLRRSCSTLHVLTYTIHALTVEGSFHLTTVQKTFLMVYPFCFDFFHYPPPLPPPLPPPPSHDDYLEYFGISDDSDFLPPSDYDNLFLNPSVPPPPSGWLEFRRPHYR